MTSQTVEAKVPATRSEWYRSLSKYEKPDLRKAIGQLLDTMIPYFALWGLMVWMIRQGVSYWLVLPLIVLAAGLLVRIFIFFHDCCHGSFFASRRANRILGHITGALTFTPFADWQQVHAEHHATAGDLDRRGSGDIWTMTVEEYRNAPKLHQIAYWLFRNPLVLFILAPPVLFLIVQRFPHRGANARMRRSVHITNLMILGIFLAAGFTIGWKTYLMIQLPVMMVAGAAGVWLFYVQHQYEGVFWGRHDEWDPVRAALEDSSYYKLPKVLQWFTGNIGLHHIHHLRPRIPNYNLQRCYDEVPELQAVEPLTLRKSLKSLTLNLWDEPNGRLVSFRSLRSLPKQNRV